MEHAAVRYAKAANAGHGAVADDGVGGGKVAVARRQLAARDKAVEGWLGLLLTACGVSMQHGGVRCWVLVLLLMLVGGDGMRCHNARVVHAAPP